MSTNKDKLDGITVFVRVVESGGFSKAADLLGHSTSYISKEVTRLENRLGVRLLNRSTRTIRLTDLGKTYYERCLQVLADVDEVENSLSSQHEVPKGVLKIGAPVSFGHIHLQQVLPEFLDAYPQVQLDVEFNDKMVDIVADGFDVVIRAGTLKDSNLINRKIMQSRGVTVASPDYLERRGFPEHPLELAQHDCISYSHMQLPDHWEFVPQQGKPVTVNITPRVISNSSELELAMVLAGMGITRIPSFCCENQLKEGRLVSILEEYHHRSIGVYAVFPHRRHLSAKVRVFVDFLVEKFSATSTPGV